uniref:Uncharacterized protein n=1 Tax=Kwoniella dejecticola CBS 10117 TaxID=1296121 RepID=A0A1A6A6Q8_9TREE|nr:uncharacterized protein I303_03450 [Kwoniella dejecticola CBS 10117]OBR85739.1 hypothetical protein I303_03450 [Kwoniella dejecticola CBS 10117]
MALTDYIPGESSSHKGANDIPAPRSDATVNAPPPEQHKRVADFVKEAPNARYTFDSRRNADAADAELCRYTPEGGRSCIKQVHHCSRACNRLDSTVHFLQSQHAHKWNVLGFLVSQAVVDQ